MPPVHSPWMGLEKNPDMSTVDGMDRPGGSASLPMSGFSNHGLLVPCVARIKDVERGFVAPK